MLHDSIIHRYPVFLAIFSIVYRSCICGLLSYQIYRILLIIFKFLLHICVFWQNKSENVQMYLQNCIKLFFFASKKPQAGYVCVFLCCRQQMMLAPCIAKKESTKSIMIEVVELTKIDFYLSFFSVDKKQISMARSSYLHSNLLLDQPLQTYIFHKASCQSQIYVLNQGVGGGIFVNTCLQRNTCMYLQIIYGFIQFSPFTGKSSSTEKEASTAIFTKCNKVSVSESLKT